MSQKILVDMTPGFRQPTVYFSQGDIGTTFNVDLTSRFGDSLPASPTITLQATKPSGLGFSVSATSISGSIVTFTMTETMTNEAGRFPAELKIVNSGVTIYTANFYMQGEKSAHPEGTTDGDLDHILPRYMSVQTITLGAGDSASYSFDPETNTAIFGIPKGADGSLSSDVLAPTYSASATYSVGDYVYYNGALFRCTTAITTAEAWTSAHWAQVALAPEVTDLKSDIDLLIEGKYGYRIKWVSGDINSSGAEVADSTYVRTGFIPIEILRGKSFHLNGTNTLYAYYYDASKAFLSRTAFNADGTFNPSTNVIYVRFATRAEHLGKVSFDGIEYDTEWKENIDSLLVRTTDVESDVSDLKEEMAGTTNYEEGYYISTTGELVADEDYSVTEKINIESIPSANFWYGTYDSYKVRLCSFNANDEFVDYWGGLADSEYRNVNNFGTGATYVRFSFPKGYEAKLTSSVQSDGTYTTYWQAERSGGFATHKDVLPLTSSVIGKEGLSKYASSLASGSSLTINSNISIKKNKVYHLHTLIDSNFDTVYFGHGESTYSLYFKIDNTNITFMTNGSEGSQLPHGLTLDTYIDFMLIVGEKNTGTIILNTLGGVYTRTVQTVNGYKGNVFVRPSGCSLTDVFIGFSCTDFRQPIWMFGDSYFTHTSDARWTYWLIEWGFGRCLLNAFPGENSSEALPQALSYLANNGTPKYIVWCMGMNDPDSGAVNASWLACVETLISNCEKYGVEPILATIPNVPSYDNTYKNAWIKASGYKYIDFAKAVGAESAGSTWYAGCLSSDNTHPSEKGARLLCLQALQDVSELTLGNI